MEPHVELITPEKAAAYLKKNTSNRKVSHRWVAFLADEMTSGAWVYAADPIRFNGERLIDGQHRLLAIVKSGVSIEAIIAEGLGDDAQLTIDSVRSRTGADFLTMKEHVYTKDLAATARYLLTYLCGHLNRFQQIKISNRVIVETVERFPDLVDSVNYVRRHFAPKHGSYPVAALIHFVAGHVDAPKRDAFFESVCQGLNIQSEGNPANLLRQKFAKKALGTLKIVTKDQLGLWIRAWNHYFSGTEMKILQHSSKHPMPLFDPPPDLPVLDRLEVPAAPEQNDGGEG